MHNSGSEWVKSSSAEMPPGKRLHADQCSTSAGCRFHWEQSTHPRRYGVIVRNKIKWNKINAQAAFEVQLLSPCLWQSCYCCQHWSQCAQRTAAAEKCTYTHTRTRARSHTLNATAAALVVYMCVYVCCQCRCLWWNRLLSQFLVQLILVREPGGGYHCSHVDCRWRRSEEDWGRKWGRSRERNSRKESRKEGRQRGIRLSPRRQLHTGLTGGAREEERPRKTIG